MLGYAFMGKAHSRALLALRHLDVPLRPELVFISRIGLFVDWGDTFVHEHAHLLEAILSSAESGRSEAV